MSRTKTRPPTPPPDDPVELARLLAELRAKVERVRASLADGSPPGRSYNPRLPGQA